tara:strand:+ start:1495 stop:2085 length:591 start_codon:yes stop_codon:yes gene_type:complete
MFRPQQNRQEAQQQVVEFARNSGNQFDPILAGSAPPGIGMTQDKGKWQWEQPPLISDPDQAVDSVIEQFELAKENIIKLMVAGISIEEIVSTTVFNGFMEGKFNPDIAELIKPALSLYLMKLADDVDAPFKLYAEDQPTNEIDDEELFQVMQQRNPEMFNKMLENANKTIRMGKDRPQQQPQIQQAPQNFLQMGDS